MVVIAMPEEAALVRGNGNQEPLVTGVGGMNVYEALRDFPRDTPIHNVGYAGSNQLPVGTRCRVGTVLAYHPNATFQEPEYHLDGDTPCFTAGDFVTSTDIKEPCVFDMELAYILAMGFTNVTAEKVVSDNLSATEFENFVRG